MGSPPADWSPDDVDITQPSVARVYDFVLGGSHNFEADREFGRRALAAYPDGPLIARDHRSFLRRSVLHACAQGIDQFLDLGSGIPTVGNVHDVAHGVHPGARVVYVDRDPVAVTHSRALLEGDPNSTAVRGDVRDHAAVLGHVRAGELLDLDRPVAVLMIAVAHFLSDDDGPADVVAEYMRSVPAGSLLALSHARGAADAGMTSAAAVYDRDDSPGQVRLRTHDEIAALFGDLTMIDPGLVPVPVWHPELTGDPTPTDVGDGYPGLAGVGRRD